MDPSSAGRVIGAAFLLPFLWFLWKGFVGPGLRGRLWTIFGLGALQGAAGWWMVASGLADRLNVSQYRLAFHLTPRLRDLRRDPVDGAATMPAPPANRRGCARRDRLVARAVPDLSGRASPACARPHLQHWPLIDGGLVPTPRGCSCRSPGGAIFENALTVQFVHRTMAYVLWIAALAHAADVCARPGGPTVTGALLLWPPYDPGALES